MLLYQISHMNYPSGTVTSRLELRLNLNKIRIEDGDSMRGLPANKSFNKSSSRYLNWNFGSSLIRTEEEDVSVS